MHTEAHLFSVPNDCLWYDKLWGPSQRVVTLFYFAWLWEETDLETKILHIKISTRYKLNFQSQAVEVDIEYKFWLRF